MNHMGAPDHGLRALNTAHPLVDSHHTTPAARQVVELCFFLSDDAKDLLGKAYAEPIRPEEYVREYVERYLQRPRRGEDVFFDLTGHSPFIEPYLIKAYGNERDREVRFGLLEAISENRLSESVVFLGQVLETDLWKPALDGLVTIGGPSAAKVLKKERQRIVEGEGGRKQRVRFEWIDEAIQQIIDQGLDVTER
jgi:hypothetical protein